MQLEVRARCWYSCLWHYGYLRLVFEYWLSSATQTRTPPVAALAAWGAALAARRRRARAHPGRLPVLAMPCRGQNCIRANSPSLGAAPLAFLLHFAHCCATPCRCFFFRSVRKPRMCSTATLASGCVSSRAA